MPTILFLAGLPGAGKTTLALALGRVLGWPVVDKDTLKSSLLLGDVPEELAGPASYKLLLPRLLASPAYAAAAHGDFAP